MPLSISFIKPANCIAVNGNLSYSIPFSLAILMISPIIQLLTALAFPHSFVAASKKSDKCFDDVKIPASYSGKPSSSIYLFFLLSGNSGNASFIF